MVIKRPRRRLILLSIASIGFMVAGYSALRLTLGAPATEVATPPTNEPTEAIIVKYKVSANQDSLRAKINGYRGRETGEIKRLRMKVARIPKADRDQTISKLAADPQVEYVEPDYVYREHATTPNDTLYPQQWEWTQTRTNEAWDTTQGSSTVIVAVLDSGINTSHPEFAGKLVPGLDVLNNDNDPADDRFHGTQVSGVIGALSNNSRGIASGCWNCKIMPIKIANSSGASNNSNITKGIDFAINNGAKVIVMSLGGGSTSNSMSDAIAAAVAKGVVVVASAGNNSTATPQYPASLDSVLSVAASDRNDNLTGYSNYGDHIDVAAPGTVQTTDYPGDGYKSASGTSFSAPLVASVAALLKSAYPNASAGAITNAITSTADPCCNGKIKGGRINSAKALAYLAANSPSPVPPPAPAPPAPTPPPTPPNLTPNPTPTPALKSPDFNSDGKVGIADLSYLLSRWSTADSRTDLNSSGRVDIADLSSLLSKWTR